MAIQTLFLCRMSRWQGVNAGLAVTGDALTELRDLDVPGISGNIRYLSIQVRNDKDRKYGK